MKILKSQIFYDDCYFAVVLFVLLYYIIVNISGSEETYLIHKFLKSNE